MAVSGQKVRVILKNNFHYSGKIIDTNEISITLTDKFGKKVSLAKDSILVLEEVSSYD